MTTSAFITPTKSISTLPSSSSIAVTPTITPSSTLTADESSSYISSTPISFPNSAVPLAVSIGTPAKSPSSGSSAPIKFYSRSSSSSTTSHSALILSTKTPSKLGTVCLSPSVLQHYVLEVNQPVLVVISNHRNDDNSSSSGWICNVQILSQSNSLFLYVYLGLSVNYSRDDSTNPIAFTVDESRKSLSDPNHDTNVLVNAKIYPLRMSPSPLASQSISNVCRLLIITLKLSPTVNSQGNVALLVAEAKAKLYGRYACAGCSMFLTDDRNNQIELYIQQSTPRSLALVTAETLITYEESSSKYSPSMDMIKEPLCGDSPYMSPAERTLYEMISITFQYPHAFEKLNLESPKGLLLYGPPGVGKTYTVRMVCQRLNINLIAVEGSSLWSPFAGEAEIRLRSLFENARSSAQQRPSLLFIDEIDVLCPARSKTSTISSNQSSDRIVAQMLALLDGMHARGNLFVVAATNFPNKIDPALRRPGRLDREIHIDVPTLEIRTKLLRKYTANMKLEDITLDELAARAVGYVGADIEALAREAALNALRRKLASMPDYPNSIATIPRSNTRHAHHLQDNGVYKTDWDRAFELVPSSSRRGFVLSASTQSDWSDIGGLDNIIRKMKQAVEWPLLYSQTMKQLNIRQTRGILLYGPAGNGKTSIVRALANSTNAAFLMLDSAAVLSSYVGEAERILREAFNRARANLPCILFIDELDALVGKRSFGGGHGSSGVELRILSTLLNEMDGMNIADGLTVIAATNRVNTIDDALLRPGRFDYVLEVPLPDEQARLSILRAKTRHTKFSPDVSLSHIAALTKGYSGAELSAIVREACFMALREDMEASEVNLTHFERALQNHRRMI